MEIQDVFGWVALFVFTALGGWALKQPFGKIGVTVVVFTVSVFTLGYSLGMRTATGRVEEYASNALEACLSNAGKDKATAAANIEKCTVARYAVTGSTRGIRMPMWAEAGSMLLSLYSFGYLGYLILQLAMAQSRYVITPKANGDQHHRAPEQTSHHDG